MLITKIELHNITTHKRTRIDFQKGLNLLYGNNGTGKSTVLNMIGFILFNYIPGTQKSYLRKIQGKKPRYGTIKLWVIGLDDEQYIIERTIAKGSPKIEVSYGRTGVQLSGINNANDLQDWVKKQLSLPLEINLPELFRTSIGVPQGTFTEPFLRTPRNRQDFFNPILQVDVYDDVWHRLLNIINLFKEDITESKGKETELSTRLEPKEEVLQKRIENKEILQKTKEQYEIVKLKIIDNTDKYEKLKKYSDELYDSDILCQQLEIKSEELLKSNKNLNDNLKKAKEAKNICYKTKKAYDRYEQLIIEEKNLRQLNEKLNSTKEKIKGLSQELTKLETSKTEITLRYDQIKKEQETFPKIKLNFEEYDKLQKLIQIQREKLVEIKKAEKDIEKFKKKNFKLNTQIVDAEKKLEVLPGLIEKSKDLSEIIEEKHALELNINTLRNDIQRCEENINISQKNICPILKEECKNVGNRSFKNLFEEQIEEYDKLLSPKLIQLNQLENELENSDEIERKLNDLRLIEKECSMLNKQKIDLGKEISLAKEDIKHKSKELEILKRLEKQSSLLETSVEEYNVLKDKIEKILPDLEQKLSTLGAKIIPINKKLEPLLQEREKLIKSPDRLSKINIELDSNRKNHDIYQRNEQFAKNLITLEESSESKDKELKNLELKLKIELVKKNKLENLFSKKKFEEIEENLTSLKEKRGELKNRIENSQQLYKEADTKLNALLVVEKELELVSNELQGLQFMKQYCDTLRSYFKIAIPKITEALLRNINIEATNHYRHIMDDPNVLIIWDKEFNVKVKTAENEKEFFQLSGGEQMSVALAVRLAILKILSNIEFAFFDEPTTNLDPEKRENLSKIIQRIKGFQQLFVISHDDTFEENVDNVIKFDKDNDGTSKVSYLTNSEEADLV